MSDSTHSLNSRGQAAAPFARAIALDSGSSRGQAAVEVLVYVGFFLLVFVVVSLFFVLQVGQDISQRQYRLAQSTAGQVSDDLQLALQAGPGFNASFILPPRINGFTYAARFYKTSMYIELDSNPPTRFYYPIGVDADPLNPLASSLTCDNQIDGGPGAPACTPGELRYCPCVDDRNTGIWFNLSTSGGKMRVVNKLDSNGQPQLWIHPVS
ncbi:MAG: hypothetical protein KGH63_01390 [Candidatus Micrarchaeota archaeon]|nr:hypothetical protein [Candidatus Micrarchaeota archaeon]